MAVKEEAGGMLHDRDGQCGAIKEEDPNGALNSCGGHGATSTGSLTRSDSGEEGEMDANGIKREEMIGPDGTVVMVVKREGSSGGGVGSMDGKANGPTDHHRGVKCAESDLVRDLRNQLKKALNDQKEMKLLLDMYKGVPKEQRDKVQLMASEKKKCAEIEDLKCQMKKLQESKREDRKKLADEEALRKIKQLEEQKYELQKQVQNQKQPPDSSWSSGYRPFVRKPTLLTHLCSLFLYPGQFGLVPPLLSILTNLSFGRQVCSILTRFLFHFTGRRGSPKRDGSDGTSVRGHAGAKLKTDTAVAREGRCKL